MKRLYKLPLIIIGIILIIFMISSIILNALASPALEKKYAITPSGIKISNDKEVIARGKYLVHTVTGCAHCHEEDLSGKQLNNDPLIGRIWSDNLTPGAGGVGKHLTTEDWVNIIRHGVKKSGRAVNFIPAQSFNQVSKPDMTAIVSYLVTLEPIDERHPKKKIGPLTNALFLAGMLPVLTPPAMIDHEKDFPPYIKPEVSAKYGKYLATIGGCTDCHGEDLKGRPSLIAPPGTPPAPDITRTGTAKEWSKEKFIKVMNTGRVTKTEKLNTWMPWEFLGKMTEDDLTAMYIYLNSVK